LWFQRDISGGGTELLSNNFVPGFTAGGSGNSMTTVSVKLLGVGDRIKCRTYQNSGGDLDLTSSFSPMRFLVARVW
jgi:hypothetical protein